jgi:MFS transporter, DHA1 family, multidrug resistance protein
VALWIAEFLAVFSFALALPFVPLYLHQDLGITGSHELPLWSGLIAGADGIAMAIASPIWGMLADRHGRKPMLLRAMIGAAITIGLMSLVQTAGQLLILGIAEGAASGTIAAGTALTAAETPRSRVAWAMGVLSSAIALGGALAPLIGGLVAAAFGLRPLFASSGIMLGLSAIPVLLIVRESPRARPKEEPAPRKSRTGFLSKAFVLKAILLMVGVLVLCQALTQFSWAATEQLTVLRILQVSPLHASIVAGIALAAMGLATSVASMTYSRGVKAIGYRWLALIAAVIFAICISALGLAASVLVIVIALTFLGLAYGSLYPALSAMLSLRAPREVQATVYGLFGSATAIGFGLGPLIGGAVAAATQVRIALLATAGVAVVLCVVIGTLIRDPRTPT